MPSLASDRKQLLKAARLAREAYLRLSDELNNLVLESPSIIDGMQSPDGIQAISNLGKERNAAFEKYLNALTALRQGSRVADKSGVNEPRLTPRERQILTLVAGGKSSKEIAATLGIAFRTVVAHRYHMQTKLGAHKAADLTRAAVRLGLIQP